MVTNDGMRIIFWLKEDGLFLNERVSIENLSQEAIYIPDVQNRDIYFFILNTTAYSYFGVRASLLGSPSLASEVKLLEIPSRHKIEVSIKVRRKSSALKDYYYSFDYLKKSDLNIGPNGGLPISMEKYIGSSKYAICRLDSY
jgi:hypothetical protein